MSNNGNNNNVIINFYKDKIMIPLLVISLLKLLYIENFDFYCKFCFLFS